MFPLNAVAAAIRYFPSWEQIYTLTAGVSGLRIGYVTNGAGGSLSPNAALPNTNTINDLSTAVVSGVWRFRINTPNWPNDDTSFAEIELAGSFAAGSGPQILRREDAGYNPSVSGTTEWTWPADLEMVSGNSYTLTVRGREA